MNLLAALAFLMRRLVPQQSRLSSFAFRLHDVDLASFLAVSNEIFLSPCFPGTCFNIHFDQLRPHTVLSFNFYLWSFCGLHDNIVKVAKKANKTPLP
ncbi:hypothetical protein BGW37DRAFT_497870 [Umbelopsis sp. PMI_123]|nr:hypothetical protein BGW37DRAFT_497870 [Umbelopsis sp. PMI_123]